VVDYVIEGKKGNLRVRSGRLLGGSVLVVRALGSHTDHVWDLPEVSPLEVEFVLALVQDVAEPDTPDDVEIGADARHEVPCPGQQKAGKLTLWTSKLTTTRALRGEYPTEGRPVSASLSAWRSIGCQGSR